LTVEALEKRIMDAVEKDILSMTEIDKEWAEKCRAKGLMLLKRIFVVSLAHMTIVRQYISSSIMKRSLNSICH
jgi:hypothetical protein